MNLSDALSLVIELEGGDRMVDHSDDPGGRTRFGISEAAHPEVWEQGPPSREEAESVYVEGYWLACHCPKLPRGVDLMTFDAAVNHGPDFAVRVLQTAIGATVDGVVGPQTIRLATDADPVQTLQEMAARRGVRYGEQPTFDVFGLGWMRRLSRVYRRAVQDVLLPELQRKGERVHDPD